MRIIDIEGEWRFTHEDLLQNQGGVIGGGTPAAADRLGWRNHGTAVIGVFGADTNSVGVTGICADANVRAHSIFGAGNSSSAAITAAAARLSAGDIMLLELHRPGPRNNFQNRADQDGYIAVEWWPDDFAAILFATSRGIIVVEAAGNGSQNLDDAIYGTRPNNFPAGWRNPFNRANPDCGAIIVGAGAPATLNFGPDRSRLGFSNFGACVDAQGWGEDVATSGYGTLQGGGNEDLWYTASFNGTSSASPVVVGALGCVQGILRARSRPVLTPATARAVLRTTGSPQLDAPGRPATQRIGNRPNIRGIINQLLPKLVEQKGLMKEVLDKALEKSPSEKALDHKNQLKDAFDKGGDKGKETKDSKEKDTKEKEVKEAKDGKDSKEKELKDSKEKEFKDVKDSDKNVSKDFRDHLASIGAPGMQGGGGLEARVAALEAALGQVAGGTAQHFIGPDLRPDVGTAGYAEPTRAARLEMLERMKAEIDAAIAAAGGEGNG